MKSKTREEAIEELQVSALTPELRERGRVPNGTPACYAVVQRNGRGVTVAINKGGAEAVYDVLVAELEAPVDERASFVRDLQYASGQRRLDRFVWGFPAAGFRVEVRGGASGLRCWLDTRSRPEGIGCSSCPGYNDQGYPLTLDEPEECFDCQVDDEEEELYDYPTLAGCIRLCGGCFDDRREQNDVG